MPHIPSLCFASALCVVLLTPTTHAQEGMLRLCPAGGRTFMMAWSLACEMKRRKKRDTTGLEHKRLSNAEFRPATMTEVQKICCESGCEIRDLLSYCDPFGSWDS